MTKIPQKKKEKTICLPQAEYRRLKRLDAREQKMKPLILQLASFIRSKKQEEKAEKAEKKI